MTADSRDNMFKHDASEKQRKEPIKDGLDVTAVLRRAYESAVDEKVPTSMMELLEKLS